ncbi:MAG TPA: lytic transglycosylase domain-containing protein [Candidatus Binataceae bacterium]|nr:lytic transglycosylase domain-containing protein [Candidatus Binataceae bacterium]
MARLIRVAVLLMLFGTASTRVWAGELSVGDPYLAAARDAGVPSDLLIAIAGAESGYHPWALNIHGHQVFCQSRSEAESVLANTPTDDIDIGLMQINWRFWGPRSGLASKAELLDPRRNLQFGAAILRDGLSRGGSLWHRISNYHSGGSAERDRYNRMVYAAYLHYMHHKLGRGMIR